MLSNGPDMFGQWPRRVKGHSHICEAWRGEVRRTSSCLALPMVSEARQSSPCLVSRMCVWCREYERRDGNSKL